MSAATIADYRGSAAPRGWRVALGALAAGGVAFGFSFRSEISHAVGVWNESTAYNHCFLILPISIYLLWERWRAIAARTPQPAIWPLVAMAAAAAVWLLAARAGLMEGRQLAAMTMFELFIVAVVGWRVWRVGAFALLYLYFLVPSGAFLTPFLQNFAARFAVDGVALLGVPVYSDGMEIDVPGARFTVAEACAGLRFLIASVALGTLYGYMMYRSWKRRAAFILVSMIVPIIANGFRVLGLVMLGYWLGNAQAAVADHLIYGWVFFSMVSLTLILLGLPFRQPAAAFPVTPKDVDEGKPAQNRIVATAVAAIALVALLVSPVTVNGPPGAAMASAVDAFKHALRR
jgi:exosortase A